MIKNITKYLMVFLIFYLVPGVSMASFRDADIVYSNGKLSMQLNRASFQEVVKTVAEKTGTSICIFDDTDNKLLTRKLSEKSLDAGLRSILKGVNYVIVYQSGLEKGSVRWMNDQEKRKFHGTASSRNSKANDKNIPANKRSANKNNSVNRNNRDMTEGTSSIAVSPEGKNGSSENNNVLNNSTESTDGDVSTTYNYVSSGGSEKSDTSDTEESTSELSDDSSEEDTIETADTSYDEEETDDIEDIEEDESVYADAEQMDYSFSDTDMPSWYYEGISSEEASLRSRIDDLNEQIESGYADKQYDLWVQIRGDKVVSHASELLERYEDRLQELTSQ